MTDWTAHDEIAAIVASWYRGPSAEFTVELREIGWCRQPTGSGGPNVLMQDIPIDRLVPAIVDAGKWLGKDDYRLVIDARGLDSRVRPALERLGWERRGVTVFLRHLGDPPSDREDVVLRRVGADDGEMAEWVLRRSQAFADTDWVPPAAGDLKDEVRQRRLQEADGAEMFTVDRASATAGIAAWYAGPDRLVFNLAVLPSQRSHGVGAAVMARAIAGAERSTLVNTDEEEGPVDLYHRWGFTDEVYRRITYERSPR